MKIAAKSITPITPSSAPTWRTDECAAASCGVEEASSDDSVNVPGPAPITGLRLHSFRASDHSVCRVLLKLSPADNHDGHESRRPRDSTAIAAISAKKIPTPTTSQRGRPRFLRDYRNERKRNGTMRASTACEPKHIGKPTAPIPRARTCCLCLSPCTATPSSLSTTAGSLLGIASR